MEHLGYVETYFGQLRQSSKSLWRQQKVCFRK